jgi:ribosomal protein S18 acetylase RimI-like enzyme
MNQRVPQVFFKRVTTPAEAENLRVIRNKCREYMTRSTDYITPEQQEEWFKTAFRKYDLYIAYAIEHGVCLVDAGFGVVHKNEDEFLLTGGLLPEYRDMGLGKVIFKFLIDQCHKSLPIRLEVLKDNTRALKTYQALNFTITNENEKIYFMEYKYDSVV